ncbi:hypothetical protein AB7A76_05760 [Klebsiella pneumoniae]
MGYIFPTRPRRESHDLVIDHRRLKVFGEGEVESQKARAARTSADREQ